MNKIINNLHELQYLATSDANLHGYRITWNRPNEIMTVPEALALVVSEASEALEAFRDDNKEAFATEIADVVIRCLHLCGDLDINLVSVINAKMEKNLIRGFLHGRKNI